MQTIDLLRVALEQRKITRMKHFKEMEEVKKQTERIKQMNIAEVIDKAAQNAAVKLGGELSGFVGDPVGHWQRAKPAPGPSCERGQGRRLAGCRQQLEEAG